MQYIFFLVLLISNTNFCFASNPKLINEHDKALFTIPSGWVFAELKDCPPSYRMLATKPLGRFKVPITINLAEENFQGTQSEYVQLIKEINLKAGYHWRALGTIQTQAGTADLSQREVKTELGLSRQMHTVFVKGGRAYIVTATAMADDFPKHYQEIAEILKSFTLKKNEIDHH